MNNLKYIKKKFVTQINAGYEFKYSNEQNTVETYLLERNTICIKFVEDYRHEFLDMNVIWNKSEKLISTSNEFCSSKISCKGIKELRAELNRIYVYEWKTSQWSISDKQFYDLVDAYYDFLNSNAFFYDYD